MDVTPEKNTREGDVEQKIAVLTRSVLDMEKGNYIFGLSLPGITITANSGPKHVHQCLKALALLDLGV